MGPDISTANRKARSWSGTHPPRRTESLYSPSPEKSSNWAKLNWKTIAGPAAGIGFAAIPAGVGMCRTVISGHSSSVVGAPCEPSAEINSVVRDVGATAINQY